MPVANLKIASLFGAEALIIDPALHSKGGHHFNAVMRLQTELREIHISTRTLGWSKADTTVIRELRMRPAFTRSVYARDDWSFSGYLNDAETTYREMSKMLRWQCIAPQLIVLPCCNQILALAVAKYLANRSFSRPPRVLGWLLFAPCYGNEVDGVDNQQFSDEYRYSFSTLARAVGSRTRMTVCCETTQMADTYRRILDTNIIVEPGPNLMESERTDARCRPLGTHINVACIGYANGPKGYRLLPDAIERVLRHRRDVRFTIHGIVAGSDAEHELPVFQRLAQLGPRVSVRTGVLSQDKYRGLMRDADLLLLPYDPSVYKSRGSGVFTEASTLGKPVLATRGCGFAADAIAQGRAQEIAEFSSPAVAAALEAALDSFESLSAKAVLARSSRDTHALKRLLRAPGSSQSSAHEFA